MGLLHQLTKNVLETALDAEMAEHLGYDKHDPAGRGSGNSLGNSRLRLRQQLGIAPHQLKEEAEAVRVSPTTTREVERPRKLHLLPRRRWSSSPRASRPRPAA